MLWVRTYVIDAYKQQDEPVLSGSTAKKKKKQDQGKRKGITCEKYVASEGLLQDRLLATRSEKGSHLSMPLIHTDGLIQMPFHENVLIVAIVAPFAQPL